MKKTFDFPFVRQTFDYDCGSAATQMVLFYYGHDVREDEIMKLVGTTERRGTSIHGIKKALRRYKLKTKDGTMTIGRLKTYINHKVPVIIIMQAWTKKKRVDWARDWTDGHFVIPIGYDKAEIYFADPASRLRTHLSFKEFENRWHDRNIKGGRYIHYGIVVNGKKNFNSRASIHMD